MKLNQELAVKGSQIFSLYFVGENAGIVIFDLNSLLFESNCSALLRIILLWHKRGAIVFGLILMLSRVTSEGIISGNFTLQKWLPRVICFERIFFFCYYNAMAFIFKGIYM